MSTKERGWLTLLFGYMCMDSEGVLVGMGMGIGSLFI